jgi:parallel beta-helix repeat protein
MLAGIALLFAFQGFSRADDDHKANAITTCGVISKAGRYYLAHDLKQCKDGISITASDVELDLRGHTILGLGPAITSALINANGGATGLSNIEIEGPGTLTGGGVGILFQNVHRSRANNLVVVGNTFGIVVAGTVIVPLNIFGTMVKAADLRSIRTLTATDSTDNEFRDNVVADQMLDGVTVFGANQNRFIHNNLSGNGADGLDLFNANNNIARHNTTDSNGNIGIDVLGAGNIIDDNIALGNVSLDLQDETGDCANNTWTDNSFNNANPSNCIQ